MSAEKQVWFIRYNKKVCGTLVETTSNGYWVMIATGVQVWTKQVYDNPDDLGEVDEDAVYKPKYKNSHLQINKDE